VELIAARGVGVSHNPVSNMKLASGMAPVAEMIEAGVNVGLGTDGEKENNNLDMFEEMKVASLLGKLRTMDAAAMDSWQVLEMATNGGARAIGQGARLGSLEPGKQADLVAVRTDTPRMTPLIGEGTYANIHHNLVHAVRGGDVALTMVAGQVVVRDGVLLTASMDELIGRARAAVPGLFERRSAYLATTEEPSGAVRLVSGPTPAPASPPPVPPGPVTVAVSVFCTDLDAVFTFYRDLLALDEVAAVRSPIYRALAVPGGEDLGFHAPPAVEVLEVGHLRPGVPAVSHHPTFHVGSNGRVDALSALAISLGGTLVKGPYLTYYDAWQSVVQDPEGNMFRLNHYGESYGRPAADA
jgi:catechol 2,3-dioxygenase-like lactoylglutathione lyase family enzyme